jgi:uncharacterized protein (UPF0303 family)
MADPELPVPDLADLAAEEDELRFGSFDHDDAWALGSALVAAARRQGAPVAIGITRNGHRLFHAALPGTSPDNDAWIERKSRVADRFGHSSLYVRRLALDAGSTAEEMFGLDTRRYAAHGGAFPILVRSVGPVGVVVVSGLPQVEDHRMVVAALRDHLGRETGG